MNLIKALLLPPGPQLLLLLIALSGWFRFPSISFALTAIALLSLYLLSTGFIANLLMRGLENIPVVTPTDIQQSQAIVVLGTGVDDYTPEYNHLPQPSALLRQRLDYTAHLARQSGLPILVTGGDPYHLNESEVMQRYLQERGIAVRWQEAQSLTTYENAIYSAPMLREAGVNNVLLVSNAWHLRRGCKEFEQAGITCIPAPTAYAGQQQLQSPNAWLPQAMELYKSQLAIKEYLGSLWIDIRP